MMSAESDSNLPPLSDFKIVVESASRAEEIFPPPLGWTSQLIYSDPLTFRMHFPTQPPSFSIEDSEPPAPAPCIITIPDVGMGEAAFCSFFQFCRRTETCPQLDIAPTHYHTCLPGHEQDSPDMPESNDASMKGVVKGILNLIQQHQITRVVGIGIGYGATALLRAAAKAPKQFAGLVLISPVIHASPASERVFNMTESAVNRQLGFGLSRRTKDRLLARWLSDTMNDDGCSPAMGLEEELNRRNPTNVHRMIYEDIWREDASPVIKDVRARVLLVTGKESSLRHHIDDHISQFDAENVSRLDIAHTGSLPHEEQSGTVAKALKLFLLGIGFS